VPWIRLAAYEFDGPDEHWELYDITNDFSQSVDLSATFPEKLTELRALFEREAGANGVFPLRDAGSPRGGALQVPHSLDGVTKMTYTPAHVRMPESSIVNLKNASHEITAELIVPEGAPARGVIACQGGNMAGWSMYLDSEGVATYVYNLFGHVVTTVRDQQPLSAGCHVVQLRYDHDGGFGAGGQLTFAVDDVEVDHARLDRTVPIIFSMSGETFDVGIDTGAPVGPYPPGFSCSAEIIGVTLERLRRPDDATRAAMADGAITAAIRTH
jgi:arylsulfatase